MKQYQPKLKPEMYFQSVPISNKSAIKNKHYQKKIEDGKPLTQSIEADLKSLIQFSQNGENDSYLQEYEQHNLMSKGHQQEQAKRNLYNYGYGYLCILARS